MPVTAHFHPVCDLVVPPMLKENIDVKIMYSAIFFSHWRQGRKALRTQKALLVFSLVDAVVAFTA